MKYIKYLLTLVCGCALLSSCDKEPIDYNLEYVDPNTQCLYQLFYAVPTKTGAAYNIYKIQVGEDMYYNSGAAVLNTYNLTPTSAARYYVSPAENLNIQWYKGTKEELCYDRTVKFNPGVYTVWVTDFDQDPIFVREPNKLPSHMESVGNGNDTITGTGYKFYNMLYETEGTDGAANVPCDYKLQFYVKGDVVDGVVTKDYHPVGDPIGFGESTDWLILPVKKTVWNSSGYARIDYKMKKVVNGVEEEEFLQYTTSAGKQADISDYWTSYFGRTRRCAVCGIRTSKNLPVTHLSVVAQ